jgi:mannan endo-1,4-beta-mannosidase
MYPFASNAAAIFPDIANYKYRDSIEFLYDHGVVKGYDNGTFGPNLAINRAEIMKIILESSVDGNIGSGENCFSDVHDEWFARYICYAKIHGMIK